MHLPMSQSPPSLALPSCRLFREVLGQGKRMFMLVIVVLIVALSFSFSGGDNDEGPKREKSSFKKRLRQFDNFDLRCSTRSQSSGN